MSPIVQDYFTVKSITTISAIVIVLLLHKVSYWWWYNDIGDKIKDRIKKNR